MNIAVVIGHDAQSQGAWGNAGRSEFDFNDGLMNDMAFYELLPDNHNVYVLYRSADINGYTSKMIDLHERIDKLDCEVSIELHFNSFSDDRAQGHEVLYCSEGGKGIAEIMNHALDELLPTSNRGVKKVGMSDRGGGFCCRGKSKAIILEPFFGAHQRDFVPGGKNNMLLMKAISNGLKAL